MNAIDKSRDPYYADSDIDTSATGVSWPAIFAGAFAATAISAVLIILGSGFGLAIAPTAGKIAGAGLAWLVVTQWFSAGIGGYLAGRLRTKWVGVHTDEVFFRDTAHGFVTWAVATLVSITIAGSAISTLVKGAGHAAGAAGAGIAMGAAQADHSAPGAPGMGPVGGPNAYFIDSLFRADHTGGNSSTAGSPQTTTPAVGSLPPAVGPGPMAGGNDARTESTTIIMNAIRNGGEVPATDKTYLAQLVSARNGMTQAEAEKRVNDVIQQIDQAEAKIKEKAEEARKAAATVSIFLALSMLVGAFVASIAAALGGKRRDIH